MRTLAFSHEDPSSNPSKKGQNMAAWVARIVRREQDFKHPGQLSPKQQVCRSVTARLEAV